MKLIIETAAARIDFKSLPFNADLLRSAKAKLTVTIDGEDNEVQLGQPLWEARGSTRSLTTGYIEFSGECEIENIEQ